MDDLMGAAPSADEAQPDVRSDPPRSRWDALAPTVAFLVGAAMILPFAVGRFVPLRADFTFHTALVESHFRSWSILGRPSPYMDPLGGWERFSLKPASYGGTAYALISLIRFLVPLGPAMVILLAASYGSIAWGVCTGARAAGLRSTVSVAIATLLVTSGTIVTILYGRMAIAELVAWGALCAGTGAFVALARCNADARTHQAVLLVASVVFVGGHILTLAFGLVLLVGVAFAALVSSGHRPRLATYARPSGLVAMGVLLTFWQWPLTIYHFATTKAESPMEYIQYGYFFGPFGRVSFPSIPLVLDPLRRTGGDPTVEAIHNAVPALALAVLVVLLGNRVWSAPRLRPLAGPMLLLASAAGLVILPHSERLVRWFSFIGAMQYHWRLYPYVAMLIVAALIMVLRDAPSLVQRLATTALVVIAGFELTMGFAQAWRAPTTNDPVSVRAATHVVDLDPNPVYRNDSDSERDLRLPILTAPIPVAYADRKPRDAESPLVVTAPRSGYVVVPSALAPPYVQLEKGDRAVGWVRVDRSTTKGSYEGNQLWLVIDHQSGRRMLVVRPSSLAVVTIAEFGAAPSVVTTVAIVLWLLTGRPRPRWSRRRRSAAERS